MIHVLALALLQQATVYSSPPAGDTVGYWQQRASYTLVAVLEEPSGVLRGSGVLTYVNASPDTLRELWLQQHLNAFRPHSAWSATDEREGRQRFQRLPDPHHAYERFRKPPRIDGVAVAPEYPGSPDSTVVRLALPRPLLPGDSTRVELEWDARLSTLPRRQGRRGRSFDFAHWYPRVAVYDRDGWQPTPLVPAGEFYGEFGDFDVTLVLRDDQVIGTTGEVVEGDPGWERVRRWGVVAWQAADTVAVATVDVVVPPGYRRLRVIARDVHHFGWSVSPDYRYEGTFFRRDVPSRPLRVRVPDSVAVHVLYRPGDEPTWGQGQVVARSTVTLRWLESIFGPYPYPQMTVLHRIEGGGTEFPMLQMNGSPSQGLNLHEGGHIYAHGLLANNEWRAGWMDEGLTEYQSRWAQGLTAHERAQQLVPAPRAAVAGYARFALRPAPHHAGAMTQARHDLLGRAEPIGTVAPEFSEFAIYGAMVSGRAEQMFGALRDAMGDERFRLFLRLYYDRWVMRHVDELAMRRAASDAEGESLDWFFGQWVHRTGLVNYALTDVDVQRDRDGAGYVTSARVVRRGEYLHPMAVGVRVDSGWVFGRAQAAPRSQVVHVHTAERPLEVRLDPFETSPDWFRANHAAVLLPRLHPATARVTLDWPLLDQSLATRYVTAVAPLAWYTRPGGTTVALRARSNYQGLYDRRDVGVALTTRSATAALPAGTTDPANPLPHPQVTAPRGSSRVQGWLALENPMLPFQAGGRPLMGVRAGWWHLDGITRAELGRAWDRSRFLVVGDRVAHTLTVTGTYPYDRGIADGRRWSGRSATDLSWSYDRIAPAARGTRLHARSTLGVAGGGAGERAGVDPYVRAEVAWSRVRGRPGARHERRLRVFGGAALDTPLERALYVSALDPTATFANHFWRPDGGILSSDDVPFIPHGGGGMRGYDPLLPARGLLTINAEEALRIRRFGPPSRPLDLQATLFGDAGVRLEREDEPRLPWGDRLLADAGLGLALRGMLFDRAVRMRLDLPLYVRFPELAAGERERTGSRPALAPRWTFAFSDLW